MLGYAIGLAGVLIAIVAWLVPRRPRTTLTYAALTQTSLNDLSGIDIRVDDIVVPRLTLLVGRLWNSGTTAINGTSLRALRLDAGGCKVLHSRIGQVTTSSNCATLSIDISSVGVSFDYLNPGDGFDLEILHDGGQDTSVKLVGDVVDGKIIVARTVGDRRLALSGYAFFGALLQAIIVLGLLHLVILLQQTGVSPFTKEILLSPAAIAVDGLLVAYLATYFSLVFLERNERAKEPVFNAASSKD